MLNHLKGLFNVASGGGDRAASKNRRLQGENRRMKIMCAFLLVIMEVGQASLG